MSELEHPAKADGLSPFGSNPSVSPVPASIPDASGWADKRLKAAYVELQIIQATMHKFSTARGCLSTALAAIELADEHVAQSALGEG